MLYSKSTGGFYDRAIHGSNIPNDVIELTAEQHVALLAGQSTGKRIVGDKHGYPTLQDPPQVTSTQIWTQIQTKRDHLTNTGGYKVADKWFHSDPKSRSQQLNLGLLGDNLPKDLNWKTMDGSFVSMTPALVQQVLAAAAISDQAIFTAAEVHKAAMEASENPAAYDFSTGWPEVFSA